MSKSVVWSTTIHLFLRRSNHLTSSQTHLKEALLEAESGCAIWFQSLLDDFGRTLPLLNCH